jgi:hypothetical protein
VKKSLRDYTELFLVNIIVRAKQGMWQMDVCDSLCSAGYALNEQVARQVFDILPEHGLIVIIIDRDGNCWCSNHEEFSRLKIGEPFLREVCAKIDDGVEPVITQVNDISIAAAQLATERANCGYVIVALPRYSPESTMTNIDLVETLLNQIGLIAELNERNSSLSELQMKHYSVYGTSEVPSN